MISHQITNNIKKIPHIAVSHVVFYTSVEAKKSGGKLGCIFEYI